ncbi:LytR/AlgR family response regulator transcription factor [Longimicrobium sp.]|uniref:LytR/AlgR family response regulator transcription factor n=1 Tax=Longimicrobium sp. TaxID=2029185 RepID=UPI0039C8E261
MRTLIVDDEVLARLRVRTLLAAHGDVQVVGEAENGAAAIEMIAAVRPDLVMLDVQMPGVDGFGVVSALGAGDMPAVVFVTAFDEFAVHAFEANAVDYLMKPVSAERLAVALDRVRARLARAPDPDLDPDPALLNLMRDVRPGRAWRDRFAVRTGEVFAVVRADEVAWMEAADNYVRLHTRRGTFLVRARMADMEEEVDPRLFLRVHRSTILAVDRVQRIEPWGAGEYQFVLDDGTRLTSTRPYRDRIRAAFGL